MAPAEGNPYMPSGEPWIGPDAVLHQLFMRIGTDWDGFKVHPNTFHDAGDTVVVEVRYTGHGKATGKDAGTGSRPATSGACAMVASSASSSMSTRRNCRT